MQLYIYCKCTVYSFVYISLNCVFKVNQVQFNNYFLKLWWIHSALWFLDQSIIPHEKTTCVNPVKRKTRHSGNPGIREETPLPAQTRWLPPGLSYLVLFVGGKSSFTPFPIFDLMHMLICLFQYRWTAVYLNSSYPVTGLPMKKTAVTRTAQFPVTFHTGP